MEHFYTDDGAAAALSKLAISKRKRGYADSAAGGAVGTAIKR
jgi:predicted DNA-binding WGR domain protein